MHRIRIASLVAAGLVSSSAFGLQIDKAKLDATAKAWLASTRTPGAAVAVTHRGKVVYSNGFGYANVEEKTPVTDKTIFCIGSISKQFGAAAILKLAEEKRLSVDDRISKFIPDLPSTWVPISIRQCLTHTAGLPNYTNDARTIFSGKSYTFQEIVAIAGEKPLNFAPGERWEYSNTGYIVIGEIIKRITKMPVDAYLKKQFWGPLKMTDTYFYDVKHPRAKEAKGYGIGKDNYVLVNQPPSENAGMAGAVSSTVLDLAKWDAALRTDRYVSKAAKDQMWSPVHLNSGDPYPYGFGWLLSRIGDCPIVLHGGSIPAFTAHFVRYLADDVSVITMVNTMAAPTASDLANKIAAQCLPEYFGEGAAIADDRPELTKFLLDQLDLLQKGTIDRTRWTEEFSKAITPELENRIKGTFVQLGKLKTSKLSYSSQRDDLLAREYICEFEKATVRIKAAFSADGKLAGLMISGV